MILTRRFGGLARGKAFPDTQAVQQRDQDEQVRDTTQRDDRREKPAA